MTNGPQEQKEHDEPVLRDAEERGDDRRDDAAAHDEPLGDLDDSDDVGLDVTPEIAVADSLNQALRQLRDDADRIEQMPLDGARIDAAEALAEAAAAIDEEIGSIARSDES